MKQASVKGDYYEIWEDTYKDPAKKIPPPPDPIDPADPEKYTSPPFYDPLYNVDELDKPNTGEEFVFCQGKPVVFSGYKFSTCKRDTYRREWELDDEGHLKGTTPNPGDKDKTIPPDIPGKRGGTPTEKDEKKSEDKVDVWAVGGSDFVYIDGVPMSCREGGVKASGEKQVVVDGKLEPAGGIQASGEFKICYGHVYMEN